MSIAPAASTPRLADRPVGAGRPGVPRRVRQQARDAATVMAFSAAASLGVAGLFLALAFLARQA